MYVITKNGKKTVRKTFPTYEDARSYVRKLIRKTDKLYSLFCFSRNPSLDLYNWNIKKV